jgi:hypothetical protein
LFILFSMDIQYLLLNSCATVAKGALGGKKVSTVRSGWVYKGLCLPIIRLVTAGGMHWWHHHVAGSDQ